MAPVVVALMLLMSAWIVLAAWAALRAGLLLTPAVRRIEPAPVYRRGRYDRIDVTPVADQAERWLREGSWD